MKTLYFVLLLLAHNLFAASPSFFQASNEIVATIGTVNSTNFIGNGAGLTNLPFARTFTSTNGFYLFTANADGSTNVNWVMTNSAGNGIGLTNLQFAQTFTSTSGVFQFTVNPNGSTNVNFVLTNAAGLTNLNIALTNITSSVLFQTNYTFGQILNNTFGVPFFFLVKQTKTTAAVTGDAGISVFSDATPANGGFTNTDAIATTVAVTLAMTYTNWLGVWVATNANYGATNISTGAGNISAVLSAQIMLLGAVTTTTGNQGVGMFTTLTNTGTAYIPTNTAGYNSITSYLKNGNWTNCPLGQRFSFQFSGVANSPGSGAGTNSWLLWSNSMNGTISILQTNVFTAGLIPGYVNYSIVDASPKDMFRIGGISNYISNVLTLK